MRDAAGLEVMRQALTAIPEEMGVVLVRSAYSPNIKERKDASCALFDPRGRMVAKAEHIPVHLGSMPRPSTSRSTWAPCPWPSRNS